LVPTALRRLFQPSTLAAAERLAKQSRVENATFFRTGMAGDVVAANGRVFRCAVVVPADAEPLRFAMCACAPRFRPGDLCAHLALVAGRLHRNASDPPPDVRFEASLWALLARRGLEARLETPAPPPVPAVVAEKEALLRRETRTAVEIDFARTGTRTQRQTWEESAWFRWAKAWFQRLEDAPPSAVWSPGAGFTLSWADGPSVAAPAPAVADLLKRDGGRFFAERGFAVESTGLRRSLRLRFDADDLLLEPAVVAADGTVLSEGCGERFGDNVFVFERRAFLALEPGTRLFAVPEAPAQASLAFDDVYRPSVVGVPWDASTRVRVGDVVPFLLRHRAELATLPSSLVPEAIRGGRPAALDRVAIDLAPGGAGRMRASVTFLLPGPLPVAAVVEARRRKQPFLIADGRLVDPRDPALGFLDGVGPADLDAEGRLVLDPPGYLRLRSYLAGEVTVTCAVELEEPLARLEERVASSPAPVLPGMGLFDYQQTGYGWLWFLYQSGFGGLLCDDMGLGKTHQAMALVRAVLGEGAGTTALVVCPTSLVPHWAEKLARYAPEVPVVVRHGDTRHAPLPSRGVVVTSYGVLRNEAASFRDRVFDLFVLDEAQTIKNRGTATHQELAGIRRRVAIGLTGTPVENRLEELHTLLDFVQPGYLPGAVEFTRAFGSADAGSRARLGRLIYPFVLRRTKGQVLPDLPPKLEDRRTCSLAPGQAELYRKVLSGRAGELRERLDSGPVPYLHVFALLSLLKQVCNHPALFGDAHRDAGSGKWDLFTELLSEAMESGLKVVVFSQYVKMLRLLEEYLAEQGIGFAGIRGETVDREGELARFREDPECRVFLGSLRASGLGVDLTAASVVIHYDRWWNVAREDQATDRVHRLGQRRGVQVLKLVTAGTIEEKIDAMIERKRGLGEVVAEDDPTLAKQFTREELRELLSE